MSIKTFTDSEKCPFFDRKSAKRCSEKALYRIKDENDKVIGKACKKHGMFTEAALKRTKPKIEKLKTYLPDKEIKKEKRKQKKVKVKEI